MKKMKHIKIFESFGETSSLLPEDIGTKNDVVITWSQDGLCSTLLDITEGQEFFNKLTSLDWIENERMQMVNGKNAAYVYYNSENDTTQVKGPDFEPMTKMIGQWVNSESDSDNKKYKENPNLYSDDFDSEGEEESIVMSLKKGFVTFTLADGHSTADGQIPLDSFISRYM